MCGFHVNLACPFTALTAGVSAAKTREHPRRAFDRTIYNPDLEIRKMTWSFGLKPLSSRDNPHVRRWIKLAQVAHAGRESEGQTLLDGPHLVRAAQEAAWPLCELVVSESSIESPEIQTLLDTEQSRALPCFILPDSLFKQVSPTKTPSGLLACAPLPPSRAVSNAACTESWLWLDRVQDAGNLGGLLRTAAAAGLRDVFLSKGCARAFSPKSLRAGMGAQFALRLYEDLDLVALWEGLSAAQKPGPLVATAFGKDSVSLYDCTLNAPCVWVFGSEGQGLDPALLALAKIHVVIPMAPGTDSLNVAAAAAICLFEQKRQGHGVAKAVSP
jgi:RNA methyltransferase, TrmH family